MMLAAFLNLTHPSLGKPLGPAIKAMTGAWVVEYENAVAYWTARDGATIVRKHEVPRFTGLKWFRQPAQGLYRCARLMDMTRVDTFRMEGLMRGGLIIDLRTKSRSAAEPDPEIPGVLAHALPLPPTAYVPYADIISLHKEQVGMILTTIAYAAGPVLVHCSEGKDRTGIIIALTLMIAGHTPEAAMADFMLTDGARERDMDDVMRVMCWDTFNPHSTARSWALSRSGLRLSKDVVDRITEKYAPAK